MTYCLLFYIFFKVGLFTIGGGLASVGLLNEYLVAPGYIASDTFYNMFAISQSTPGPIGVNMATYVGFEQFGLLGAIVATFGLVLPSFIIITIIVYTLKSFNKSKYVVAAFSGFRPAAIGIILSVGYMLITNSVLDIDRGIAIDINLLIKVVLFLSVLFASIRYKIHPLICVLVGGIIGGLFL